MSFTREPSKSIDSARSILHAHPAHTPRNPQIPYSGPVDGDSVHEIGYLFFAELTPARPAYTPRNPQISYSGPVDGDFGHEIGYLFTDEFKDA
ncbi:hypothetical protein BGX27_000208 [Mortierella sp. AM989]|nr:hypothetical protein BGX27_000208 [Mortierella sp. AM989]